MASLRHEYYETDEKLTLSIFDRGADPAQVSITFHPRKFTYTHGDETLVLDPLKGQIDPDASDFTVGKVKVEVRFIKRNQGRWGGLVGDSPDILSAPIIIPEPTNSLPAPKKTKNWEGITTEILESEKEKTTDQDPNVGGDSTLNGFFQKIFADSDEDTRRAMMKSYQESGGTHLSTNWGEVSKGKVPVSPPQDAEWKKWG